MLAQTQQVPPEIASRGADFIDKLASFQMPSQGEYIDFLASMHPAIAIIMLACGLVYMLQGWKVFKALVVANAAILGGFFGYQLGLMLDAGNMHLFGALAGGLLCGVLAWPLMKFAVSIMSSLAGGFLGYGIWKYTAEAAHEPGLGEYAWAGGLIGLITLGLLAFVIFKLVVMIFTSIQGSLMMVSGALGLLMCFEPLRKELRPNLTDNTHLLMLLIALPVIIGFALQYIAMAKKAAKKKKPGGGGGGGGG